MLVLFFFLLLGALRRSLVIHVHGSLDSGRCVLRPSAMTGGAASTILRSSSGRVLTPAVASGRGAVGCSASALRARDVRGSLCHVNSGGLRKASGSNDSSVVVMHGHRMRSDFDLDSVFVPHSRSFSLCSSLVKLVTVVRVLIRVGSTVVHWGTRIHVIYMHLKF